MRFKTIRISILLLILAYVGFDTLWSNQRATDWKRSLRVVIYPINADGSDASAKYIAQLEESNYDALNDTLIKRGKNYGKDLSTPISIKLAPEIKEHPPKLPETKNALNILWWSIKLRYWAWREDNYQGPKPQIRSYALFYDPKQHKVLKHSTGLQKAKIAINHLFANKKYNGQNNVVLLHELFHTLGATDKYDLQSGLPIHPDGYANPSQTPLYPQTLAEIMGGKIPVSPAKLEMPDSLAKITIGHKTAKEIGWIK